MPDKGARPFIVAAVEGMTDEAVARRLIDYAANAWYSEVASRRSESLRRAIDCLRRLVGNFQEPTVA